MQDLQKALPLLAEPKKIFIVSHYKPDGDAMGSSLGLYHYLLQLGHQPTVVSPSAVPGFLQWLPGNSEVLNFEVEEKAVLKALEDSHFIFCLDFNTPSRIKMMEPHLRAAQQPKVLIDHHLLPEVDFFTYGLSQPEKSSTCEMVYDFILLNQGSKELSNSVMTCLYTGVMTDTGSFRFPATTASVHEMIADFKHKGLEHASIHEHIYDVWSEQRMRLLGYVLSEKMTLFPEQKIGLISLSAKELNRFHADSGDTEGIVNYPLSIQGITCSVLLIERNDEVKLSFRSQGNRDVSIIAREYFAGGGHFNAAGGRSDLNLEETVKKVKKVLGINQ